MAKVRLGIQHAFGALAMIVALAAPGAALAQVDIGAARGVPNSVPVGPPPGSWGGGGQFRPPMARPQVAPPQIARPQIAPQHIAPQPGWSPRPPRPPVAQPGWGGQQPGWRPRPPRPAGGYYGGAPYWGGAVMAPYGYSQPDVVEDDIEADGDVCVTRVKTCQLYEPAPVGSRCTCRVPGGRARGHVR